MTGVNEPPGAHSFSFSLHLCLILTINLSINERLKTSSHKVLFRFIKKRYNNDLPVLDLFLRALHRPIPPVYSVSLRLFFISLHPCRSSWIRSGFSYFHMHPSQIIHRLKPNRRIRMKNFSTLCNTRDIIIQRFIKIKEQQVSRYRGNNMYCVTRRLQVLGYEAQGTFVSFFFSILQTQPSPPPNPLVRK